MESFWNSKKVDRRFIIKILNANYHEENEFYILNSSLEESTLKFIKNYMNSNLRSFVKKA